jgi:hypothetical protein
MRIVQLAIFGETYLTEIKGEARGQARKTTTYKLQGE